VAYLTHSQYGRNGNEITKNDSSEYYTGRSSGKPEVIEYTEKGTYEYNVEEGMLASTSGNIYGIYDLSGGAYEYTVAWDTESTNSIVSSYGGSFASQKGESTKYATAYHNGTSSYYPTSETCILGDATYEVNVNPGSSVYAWFKNFNYCAYSPRPFFRRGCASHGVFDSLCYGGNHKISDTFRVVMPRCLALKK